MALSLLPIVTSSTEVRGQQSAPGEDGDRLLVRPGDGAVDGRRIAPYDVVWVQYCSTESEPGRTLRRTVTDRVELVSGSHGDVVVRTQVFLGLDGTPTSERVNGAEHRTLRPLTEDREAGGRSTHIDYDGAHVSGAMIAGDPEDPAIVFDERLAEPGFDFDLVPLLLASMESSNRRPTSFGCSGHIRTGPT